MKKVGGRLLAICTTLALVLSVGCNNDNGDSSYSNETFFSFDITTDMREYASPEYDSSQYFRGVCEAIRDVGKGAFMVSPGDIDPPWHVSNTITEILGSDYFWYPVVGNHEAETLEGMQWLREWGAVNAHSFVRIGPSNGTETTYSFDYENTHFVVLNQYYDGESDVGTNGDVCDALYGWLQDDLEQNEKPVVFVFGHEPFVPVPDEDNGRLRHLNDSLNEHPENNHRFQALLREHEVKAYICGHTHNCSFSKINGLWQLDAGHARGIGDTGAKSTFLKVWISGTQSTVEIYRYDGEGGFYSLAHVIALD